MQVVPNEWRGTPVGRVEYIWLPDESKIQFRIDGLEDFHAQCQVHQEELDLDHFGAIVKARAEDVLYSAIRQGYMEDNA